MKPPARMDWRWLDRIARISEDEASIEARRVLEPNEWYFEHHFPGFAVLPGIFLVEAMAHTAGMLQTARVWRRERKIHDHVITHVEDARFYRFARPGDELVLTAALQEDDGSGRILARTQAVVRGEKIARARLVLHRIDSTTEGFPASADGTSDAIGAYAYLRGLLDEPLRERYQLAPPDRVAVAGSSLLTAPARSPST